MGDRFGASLALNGDVLVVGAPGEGNDAYGETGAIYVFQPSANRWGATKLTAQQTDGSDVRGNFGEFGADVSVSGDMVAVGAPGGGGGGGGAVFLYRRQQWGWVSDQVISAQTEEGQTEPLQRRRFGASVDLQGATLAVGAPDDAEFAPSGGAAYMYRETPDGWLPERKLIASLPGGHRDVSSEGHFGTVVDVDGDSVAISSGSANAVYLFERGGVTWSPSGKLRARLADQSLAESSGFGAALGSLHLTADGLVVGAPYLRDGANVSGAALLYRRVGEVWGEPELVWAAEPTGADPVPVGHFGSGVAWHGENLYVGAPGRGAEATGGVYAFRREGSVWSPQRVVEAYLPDSTGSGDDRELLGVSLAIDEETAAACAPIATGGGGTYVWVNEGGSWELQERIDWNCSSVVVSGDGLVAQANGDLAFYQRTGQTWGPPTLIEAFNLYGPQAGGLGGALALEGDTLVASGSNPLGDAIVYIYRFDGTSWNIESNIMTEHDLGGREWLGLMGDGFASSIALSGDRLVLGSPVYGLQGEDSGAAFVFVRDGFRWHLEQTLLAVDSSGERIGDAFDEFGSDVSISGDTIAVRAKGDDDQGDDAGAVYVFVREGEQWTLQQKIFAQSPTGELDASSEEYFGRVSLRGERLLVGTYRYDSPGQVFDAGRALLYERSGEIWTSTAQLMASFSDGGDDHNAGSGFGEAVALSDDYAFVGASIPDNYDSPFGAVYVYKTAQGQVGGSACSFAAQCMSGSCIDGYCCDDTCETGCSSCAAYRTGAENGVCAPLAEGTICGPPPQSCSSANEYSLTPTCDGVGVCQSRTVPCADNFACDGDSAQGACATHCKGQDFLCTGGSWCDPNGACVDDLGAGERCLRDAQCASDECVNSVCKKDRGDSCNDNAECAGNRECVDGYCCATACLGQCEACDVPGHEGTCSVVEGEPHGSRPRCDSGNHETCASACDGGRRDGCTYPAQGTPCEAGTCMSDGVLAPARSCDGAGICALEAARSCFPYGCSEADAACHTECDSDEDCASGSVCQDTTGQCVQEGDVCLDVVTVLRPSGDEADCSPYVCLAGACRDSCSTANDCAQGYECDGARCQALLETMEEEGEGGEAAQDGGCSLSSAPQRPARPAVLSLLGLGLLLLGRRRWRGASLLMKSA